MSIVNEAERGITMAAELRALKDRVAELEALLDTVRAHERKEEGARIRRELLTAFRPYELHSDRPIATAEAFVDVLDRIVPTDDEDASS